MVSLLYGVVVVRCCCCTVSLLCGVVVVRCCCCTVSLLYGVLVVRCFSCTVFLVYGVFLVRCVLLCHLLVSCMAPCCSLFRWPITSTIRMRHPNGIQELLQQLHRQLRLPPGLDGLQLPGPGAPEGPLPMALGDDEPPVGGASLFRTWIYLTQVLQSLCYTTAITHWRRLRSVPEVQCMGVLYWQLNDIAQVCNTNTLLLLLVVVFSMPADNAQHAVTTQFPSWSGINHGGRWKLLHYSARRFFAPVLTSGVFRRDTGTLEVHVTNDRPTDFNGVTA